MYIAEERLGRGNHLTPSNYLARTRYNSALRRRSSGAEARHGDGGGASCARYTTTLARRGGGGAAAILCMRTIRGERTVAYPYEVSFILQALKTVSSVFDHTRTRRYQN